MHGHDRESLPDPGLHAVGRRSGVGRRISILVVSCLLASCAASVSPDAVDDIADDDIAVDAPAEVPVDVADTVTRSSPVEDRPEPTGGDPSEVESVVTGEASVRVVTTSTTSTTSVVEEAETVPDAVATEPVALTGPVLFFGDSILTNQGNPGDAGLFDIAQGAVAECGTDSGAVVSALDLGVPAQTFTTPSDLVSGPTATVRTHVDVALRDRATSDPGGVVVTYVSINEFVVNATLPVHEFTAVVVAAAFDLRRVVESYGARLVLLPAFPVSGAAPYLTGIPDLARRIATVNTGLVEEGLMSEEWDTHYGLAMIDDVADPTYYDDFRGDIVDGIHLDPLGHRIVGEHVADMLTKDGC